MYNANFLQYKLDSTLKTEICISTIDGQVILSYGLISLSFSSDNLNLKSDFTVSELLNWEVPESHWEVT